MFNRNCKTCEKSLEHTKNRDRNRVFCSKKCYGISLIGTTHNRGCHVAGWFKGKKIPQMTGKLNPRWKGEKVSYRNLHRWVEKQIGKPNTCTHCGIVGYGHEMHWANKSRNYKRNLTDWIRLCAKCHAQYDGNRGRKRITQSALS